MTRLLTLVVLGIALVSTLAEARSKRIHVTAKVVEATFTGAPDHPKIGDQRITIVDLYDKNDTKVGTGVGVCTLVTTPNPDALQQCLLTAAFDEEGTFYHFWRYHPVARGRGDVTARHSGRHRGISQSPRGSATRHNPHGGHRQHVRP